MTEGSTVAGGMSIWKIALGVFGGLVLAGTCAVGGCVFLLARGQLDRQEYVSRVNVSTLNVEPRGEYFYIRGSVRNNGSRVVTYWKVTIRYRDRDGVVYDSAITNSADHLRPGESKGFEVMKRQDGKMYEADPDVDEVNVE